MIEEISQQEIDLEISGYQQWLSEQTPEERKMHIDRFNSTVEQRREFELGYKQWFESLSLEGQQRHIDELGHVMGEIN